MDPLKPTAAATCSASSRILRSMPVPTFKKASGLPSLSRGASLLRADQFSSANTHASPRSSACRNSLKGARAPAPYRFGLVLLGFVEPADHGRQYVASAGVVIVVRPIEIRWHQADGIKAMLEPESFTEFDTCDFRDGIPSIGGL